MLKAGVVKIQTPWQTAREIPQASAGSRASLKVSVIWQTCQSVRRQMSPTQTEKHHTHHRISLSSQQLEIGYLSKVCSLQRTSESREHTHTRVTNFSKLIVYFCQESFLLILSLGKQTSISSFAFLSKHSQNTFSMYVSYQKTFRPLCLLTYL